MFCPKCGAANADGATFCASCGAKLEVAPEAVNPTPVAAEPVAPVTPAADKPENAPKAPKAPKAPRPEGKKSVLPAIIFLAVVAIAVIAVVMIILNSGKKDVELTKYFEITYEGYDGLGKATYSFNNKAFKNDFGDKLKVDKKALTKYLEEKDASSKEIKAATKNLEKGDAADVIKKFTPVAAFDKATDLSNGDRVELVLSETTLDAIEQLAVTLHCNIICDDTITDTVSGLTPIDKFDPFEHLEVRFDGKAPFGYMYYSNLYDIPEMGDLYFTVDRTDNLKNGDVVKITCNVSGNNDYFIERYAKLPAPLEKEYTVEGLLSYVESNSQITDDAVNKMIKQSSDIFMAQVANHLDSRITINSFDYIGNYLLTSKNQQNYGTKNLVCTIYKVRATLSAETNEGVPFNYAVEYYYYVNFYDLMLDGDNCEVDITNYDNTYDQFTEETELVESIYWGVGYKFKPWFYGYRNLDEIYSKLVTRNLENFNHEDSVTDPGFGVLGLY